MVELNEPCGADVDCGCNWDECDHNKMVRWRSGLVTRRDRTKLFPSCSGVRVAWLDSLSGHGLTVVMQREQLLGHASAVGSCVLGRGLRRKVRNLDGEFRADEEEEVEEAGPGEGSVTARERLESIIYKMRIRVLANVGGDKRPSRVEVLAVAADDIILDVGEVWLAAGNAAWSRFAEEVLHALGDEEGDNKRESKASPAFLPLPKLSRDHGLS